jgi:hypothetical protein
MKLYENYVFVSSHYNTVCSIAEPELHFYYDVASLLKPFDKRCRAGAVTRCSSGSKTEGTILKQFITFSIESYENWYYTESNTKKAEPFCSKLFFVFIIIAF